MGTPLSRIGDKNNGGGKLIRGATTVIAEGRPVALHVSPLTPHAPKPTKQPHKRSVTIGGGGTVFVEGSPVVHVGMKTSCGHVIVQGCGNVIV